MSNSAGQRVSLRELDLPVLYTRDRIENYVKVRDLIKSKKDFGVYKENDLEDKERILWKRRPNDNGDYNVAFLSAVEMHPNIHTTNVQRLHYLNNLSSDSGDKRKKNERILSPGIFVDVQKGGLYPPYATREYLNEGYRLASQADLMAKNHKILQGLHEAWKGTLSEDSMRADLQKNIQSHNIQTIVCFGLGQLWPYDQDGAKIGAPLLQHFFVLTLATLLNEIQQPNAPPVTIALQDPAYRETDKALIKQLFKQTMNADTVVFRDHPEAILDINTNSMVVIQYLPNKFPILQIMADLTDRWPAGIMVNMHEEIDENQSLFSINDHLSPRAIDMFKSYRRSPIDVYCGKLKEAWQDPDHTKWVDDTKIWWREQASSG